MTKAEAKAILNCRGKIILALGRCEGQLKGDTLIQAQAYWMAHIRNIVEGQGYGSAPIARAIELVEEDL